MKKIKDELIHWLGGMTEEDVRVRTRPVRIMVSNYSIRTLKVCKLIRKDMVAAYPECTENAKKDIAYQMADKMIEEKLIEFSSADEDSFAIRMSALARIVVPMEVNK